MDLAKKYLIGKKVWFKKNGSVQTYTGQSGGYGKYTSLPIQDPLTIAGVEAFGLPVPMIRIILVDNLGRKYSKDVFLSSTNIPDGQNTSFFLDQFYVSKSEVEARFLSEAKLCEQWKILPEYAFEKLRFGMNETALKNTLADKVNKLPERFKYDDSYSDYEIENYTLFGNDFSIKFLINERSDCLKTVLYSLKLANPSLTKYKSAAIQIESSLTKQYGAPTILANSNNDFMSDRHLLWKNGNVDINFRVAYFPKSVPDKLSVSILFRPSK